MSRRQGELAEAEDSSPESEESDAEESDADVSGSWRVYIYRVCSVNAINLRSRSRRNMLTSKELVQLVACLLLVLAKSKVPTHTFPWHVLHLHGGRTC